MTRWSRWTTVAATAALLTPLTGGGAAHADNFLCDNVNGAPAILQLDSRRFRAYYYHQCNGDPVANGVTGMTEFIGVRRPGPGYNNGIEYVRLQQSAAFNLTGTIHERGTYTPVMRLDITGNFSYGSMPGECGRVNTNLVRCYWEGSPKFFEGHGFEAAGTGVVTWDAVQDDPTGVPVVEPNVG